MNQDRLRRLRDLCGRYESSSFSEHLAWSTLDGLYLNDLLPVAYDCRPLCTVCRHVDQVQAVLNRRMLLENPSTYVAWSTSTMTEFQFLKEIVRRTGCGLLLDVNNVHVSATNHGWDPAAYLDAFPVEAVGEVHLAGAAAETASLGAALLVDSHDRPVAGEVWALCRRLVGRTGTPPALIEWDADIPELPVLLRAAAEADHVLAGAPAHVG
nr:DUF692 domain-containing protein [Geminicoccus roseus]